MPSPAPSPTRASLDGPSCDSWYSPERTDLRLLAQLPNQTSHSIQPSAQKEKPAFGGMCLQEIKYFVLAPSYSRLVVPRLPSPQVVLTSVFGMRTGVTPPPKHQDKTFNQSIVSFIEDPNKSGLLTFCLERGEGFEPTTFSSSVTNCSTPELHPRTKQTQRTIPQQNSQFGNKLLNTLFGALSGQNGPQQQIIAMLKPPVCTRGLT